MGMIRTELELINSGDLTMVRRKLMEESKVRKVKVTALVDSGAYMMCINETIKEQLGLTIIDEQVAELATGQKELLKITEPIEIFLNRSTSCRTLVLPGDAEILLGSMPMEDLDVIIDPKTQTLALPPDRPYIAQKPLK